MKVLVTGAAGFIGSHLCERLLADGAEVVGLDNFDPFYSEQVKRRNLRRCLEERNFRLVEGDVRDEACVRGVLARGEVEAIVHLAAKAGVRDSIADVHGYVDVNVTGTAVLLEGARTAGVQRFLFASSSSVYGNNEKVPFGETDNVDFPISPYAASKKAGELLCHTHHHLYGMNITCLRFFTVYGPRQRPDLAIHKFARLIEAGQPIPVFGDGSMARDFTYIDDILQGVTAALERCEGYTLYNLGEATPYRLDRLIVELEAVLGKKATINRRPVPPGDVKQTFADISRARERLGYDPRTPLPEGLRKFVNWLRKEAL